jgi:hypothetical protein
MSVGFDFGTSVLVSARKNKEDKTVITAERNCFLDLDISFKDTIGIDKYNFIEDEENGEKKIYICGKDAIILANLLSTKNISGEKISSLRRPMSRMVINSKIDKKSIQMLKYMSQNLIGKPEYEGEVAVISIPANPMGNEFNNVFHENMCLSFIRELGYDPYPINESLAIAYSSNPSTKDEDGNVLNMTGISCSFGGGGVNASLVFKGQNTFAFSLPKSGDWLDQQVSLVTSLTVSEVTLIKEKLSNEGKLDLSNPDFSDEIISAIYIYYNNLISMVIKQFKEKFIQEKISFPYPLEFIVSGGMSKPKGFEKLVEKSIKENSWPFEISQVIRTKDPLASTALGCLAAAISKEKKK